MNTGTFFYSKICISYTLQADIGHKVKNIATIYSYTCVTKTAHGIRRNGRSFYNKNSKIE